MGQNKCKARARRLVFWPGLGSDIENLVRTCQVCQKYAYSQPSEPLLQRPASKRPWCRVGIDLFQFAGDSYVVVYDDQSNFPDVERLVGTTAAETISKISAIFSRYGIPAQVCTDNGPQFASSDFAAFAKRYDFEHITSSPNFPRSNGLAEKGVQIVKRILKKTTEGREDFWLGMLAYRSSPLEDGRSPGELLQGRRLRSTVPEFNVEGECPVSKHRQSLQGKPLSPLDAGNVVRIKNGNWSRKATVLKEVAPRSYLVKTESQGQLRRNRQHLLQTHERCENENGYESGLEDFEPPKSVGPAVEGSEPAHGTCDVAAADRCSDPQNTRVSEETEQTESPGHPSELPTLRRSTRSRTEPQRLRYEKYFRQMC
ncbi:uncharacterized protein K02A2.6-like [Rhipicephalus sanguineus]|uniref:uncharacterized protein K02A2.6-like n=1 Tax=Rhipicephalus sanguineus TaxID=34632 RepID=UPI0020C1D892|nr:uncharacterized protein K02A2.6-like [Rhipicephalus sanguineus]